MLEDRVLLWKLQRGDANALQRIYEKYKNDLLGLAVALSHDRAAGEDAVHDIFIAFVRLTPKLRLRTSLRSYLLTAVANRVRVLNRTDTRQRLPAQRSGWPQDPPTPADAAAQNERTALIARAMAQLPDDQLEVILLHLQGGMKFREIAQGRLESINTVQSRYRYGLEKLRSLLDGKVSP